MVDSLYNASFFVKRRFEQTLLLKLVVILIANGRELLGLSHHQLNLECELSLKMLTSSFKNSR